MRGFQLMVCAALAVFVLSACPGGDSGAPARSETGGVGEGGFGDRGLGARGFGGGADVDQGIAEPGDETEVEREVPPSGLAAGLPAGYELRFDGGEADPNAIQVATIENGLEVRSGPPAILYSPSRTPRSWNYTISATFTETGSSVGSEEGFGLFFGGSDLQLPTQAYTTFLIRPDGRYQVTRQTGAERVVLTDGWVASSALRTNGGEGAAAENTLSVRVDGDQVHFAINGTEVTVLPVTEAHTHGIAGVRFGAGLHFRVTGWTLE